MPLQAGPAKLRGNPPVRGRHMLDLERQMAQRHPRWFQGPHARLVKPLLGKVQKMSRLAEAGDFLETHGHLRGLAFVEAALRYLDVRYTVDQVERERIPETGRLLVVANHPSGALDALAETLAARVEVGGRIALSGILDGQEEELLRRYRPWFDQLAVTREGDWVRIDGVRKAT